MGLKSPHRYLLRVVFTDIKDHHHHPPPLSKLDLCLKKSDFQRQIATEHFPPEVKSHRAAGRSINTKKLQRASICIYL